MKISNIAELKTRRGTTGFNVNVLGYYSAGDGGGGEFYWDNTSTETDNGGTIIQVTSLTTGRWKRAFSGSVDVRWFGAKGDGATNDTPFIQKAIDDSKRYNGAVFFSNGNYYLATSIAPYSGLSIEGESYKGLKSIAESSKPRVSLTGNGRSGYLISPTIADEYNPAAWLGSLKVKGLSFENCQYYIGNSDYTKYLVSIYITECHFFASTNVSLKGNFILSKINDCDFGYFGTATADMKHVEFVGSGILASNNNSFTGCRFYSATSTEAFLFENGNNLSFINCNIEANMSTNTCIKMNNYAQLFIIGSWLEYNKGICFVQGDTFSKNISFSNTTIVTGKTNQYFAITYTPSIASFSFDSCYFLSLGKFTNGGGTVLTECRLTFDGAVVDGSIKSFSNNEIIQNTFVWDGVSEQGAFVSTQAYPYTVKDLYKGRREVYLSAAPTTGTWEVGDVAYNTAPTTGSYVGWVCTVAGTAGTWKGFGLIA